MDAARENTQLGEPRGISGESLFERLGDLGFERDWKLLGSRSSSIIRDLTKL